MSQLFHLKPAFIEGGKGPLFAMHHEPVKRNQQNECIIVLPAFAEEMNRCRYMQTMLAQALTEQGIGLLAVDPYGTGDSGGEFSDADWEGWINDSITAANYSTQLGYQHISLLGIRLGALLAMAVMPSISNLKQLLLWQPVTNGKAALTQFLRLKIAAAMARGDDSMTTAQLVEDLNQGNNIQIAGYNVSPSLFNGIQQAHLDNHLNTIPLPVDWFSVLTSANKKAPRSELKSIETLQKTGSEITHHTIVGPAFWQAHERTLAPNLIPATVSVITGSNV